MSKIGEKFISSILCLAMIISMFSFVTPQVQAAEIDNVKIYAEKTQSQIKSNGLTKVVDNSKQQWDVEIWHYSSNFWGNKTVRIDDKDWKKTAGGVADLQAALVLDKQTFTYDVAKGSDLEKAIEEGNQVYINISSGDSSIKLSSLYEIQTKLDTSTETEEMLTNPDGTLLETDATAKVIKENGQYKIQVSVKPKLNYYTEKELSYTRTYGIALNKWVPFVANGYGYQVYSIWGGGFSAGYALGWVNQKDPYSLEGMPAGRIHPSFITSPDGHMEAGHTLTVAEKSVDSGKVRIGDFTFRNAGAVGMRFCFPVSLDIYVEGGGAQVVTSYVKLIGVNSDGTPKYEQIKAETTAAELDEKGAVKVEDIKELDEGVAYLNDVLTSPKDLSSEVNTLDWTSNLPKTTTEKIEPTAEDIWSYNLGIRFGVFQHIEDLTEDKTSEVYLRLMTLKEEFWDIYKQYTSGKDSDLTLMQYRARMDKIFAEVMKLTGFNSSVNRSNSYGLNYLTVADVASTNQRVEITNKAIHIENLSEVYLYSLDERPAKETSYEEDFTMSNKKATTTSTTIGKDTSLENATDKTTLYLRYVVIPERKMRQFVHIYKNGQLITTEITTEPLPLVELSEGNYESLVNIPVVEEAELIKWSTSKDIPLLEKMPDSPIKQGNTLEPVNLDSDENLYVEWKKEITTTTVVTDNRLLVEQWRLSKFTDNLGWLNQGYMNLNLTPDAGHAISTMNPSGLYSYKTINPNGLYTDKDYNPTNDKYNDYVHSKALTKGSYYVTHENPSATVDLTGTLNLIKGTATFGLNAATWQTNQGTQVGLELHNIKTSSLPNQYSGSAVINKSDLLQYGIENIQTYNHNYGVYYHYTCHHSKHSGCHDVCACYTLPETRAPKSGVTYITADYNINSTFDRYIAQTAEKLTVKPTITTENGKTTVAYQTDTELGIYPEVAMLFDNDKGDSSIKWVVGEQARKINPVIFHTLQFKVFVDEKSSASPFATDTRATAAATKLGESRKQVAYKGTSINTSFTMRKEENSDNTALLTVKTFALDLSENKNGVNIKDIWGASSYSPLDIHNKFNAVWNGFKGKATERLEIQSPDLYKGGDKNQAIALSRLNYDGTGSVVFTHELIVRGGVVVGVRLQNRQTKAYSTVTIDQLKTADTGLYEALQGMHLIGAKDSTVLKGFEHQTGAQLTEESFLTKANQEKLRLDGIASNNLVLNKGWYSEDSTVLVIKEIVSNYTVPSISFSDKISMSVKGLETPINKNEFFNKLGKGHTVINYTFNTNLNSINSGLKEAKVYFEHNSRTGSPFGKQIVDYLVGNVPVTDTTRVN